MPKVPLAKTTATDQSLQETGRIIRIYFLCLKKFSSIGVSITTATMTYWNNSELYRHRDNKTMVLIDVAHIKSTTNLKTGETVKVD